MQNSYEFLSEKRHLKEISYLLLKGVHSTFIKNTPVKTFEQFWWDSWGTLKRGLQETSKSWGGLVPWESGQLLHPTPE